MIMVGVCRALMLWWIGGDVDIIEYFYFIFLMLIFSLVIFASSFYALLHVSSFFDVRVVLVFYSFVLLGSLNRPPPCNEKKNVDG